MPQMKAPVTIRVMKDGKPTDVPAGTVFNVGKDEVSALVERFGAEIVQKEPAASEAKTKLATAETDGQTTQDA